MHSPKISHNGMILIMMDLEITLSLHSKVMSAPTLTEHLGKIDSDALMTMLTATPTKAILFQTIPLNGPIQIMTDMVIITPGSLCPATHSISIKPVMPFP